MPVWKVSVESHARPVRGRTRGDWAGMRSHGVPYSDQELFRYKDLVSDLRERIAAELRDLPALEKEVEVRGERRRRAEAQLRVYREQASTFEGDIAGALAHLRYAQAVARAYPPERAGEGELLVARAARDIYIAEQHLDYLRQRIATLDAELRETGVDYAALARRKEEAQARVRALKAQGRGALQSARQNMCYRKLWRQGWKTEGCQCSCGGCAKEGREGVWDLQTSPNYVNEALPRLYGPDALFGVFHPDLGYVKPHAPLPGMGAGVGEVGA